MCWRSQEWRLHGRFPPLEPRDLGGRYRVEVGNFGSVVEAQSACERTHGLTGMPHYEIVKRGIIRNEIPLYSTEAAPVPTLSEDQ